MTQQERSLTNVDSSSAATSTPDLMLHGDPDAWELVCKASSKKQGWMKSTKRLRVEGGWLYQVTTEHRDCGVVTSCAEALTFVPVNPREAFVRHVTRERR